MARPRAPYKTRAEDKVLEIIDRTVAAIGRPPTLKEIAGEMGWRAPSTAHAVVQRLKGRGLLNREPNRAIERIPGANP